MPISHRQLDWIFSEGGPLILLQQGSLAEWTGVGPPPANRIIDASFRWAGSDSVATDYDRACDINDYLGMLEVGSAWGLIINDVPDQTTWIPFVEASGGMLIRWNYAESEDDILNALGSVPDNIFKPEPFVLHVNESTLYLFDAGLAGDDISSFGDYITINLPIGLYSVSTGIYVHDSYTRVTIHKVNTM